MSLLPKRRIKNPTSQKEIATTNRNAAIIGTGLSLLIPGGFFAGIGRKAIGQAFKKAGTSGLNLKSADTVGSRIKQAQSILGKKRFDKTRIASQSQYTEHIGPGTGMLMGTIPMRIGNAKTSISKIGHSGLARKFGSFQQRKTDRTIIKAVEQGPAKFFSKGRHPKTGVTAGKRTPARYSSEENVKMPKTGARGGTSKGSLMKYDYDTRIDPEDAFGMSNATSIYHNKDLVKEILKANRLARKKLKKK